MQRLLLVFSGALFLGSTGAFFLFVSLLSIMTVASIILGLMLMFGIGFQVGTQGKSPSKSFRIARDLTQSFDRIWLLAKDRFLRRKPKMQVFL